MAKVISPVETGCECVNLQCKEKVVISPLALKREHNKGRLVHAPSCPSLEDSARMRSYGWQRIDHRGKYGEYTTINTLIDTSKHWR